VPAVLALENTMNGLIYQAGRTELLSSEDVIDPMSIARQIHQPVLITAGTKDFNTPLNAGGPPGSGVGALAAAFPGDVAELVVLADTNHVLRDLGAAADPTSPADGGTPDYAAVLQFPISAALADALARFVGRWSRQGHDD
jgi:alpha-beta hydrolase superfamily lysophospholipase